MVSLTNTCDGRVRRAASTSIALPVVTTPNGIRKSRTSRWRAGVLAGVHVVVLAHIAHWLLRGRTLSPVEPSEAMYTLNNGYVNAGFIFFGLAILSTLLFGRYFCGWGCHLVAYQDLCGWLLQKLRIKPKPFRARILVFAPLALALYMFVWPTAYRLVAGYDAPAISNHLTTNDFWQTFPGPGIAILTFAVCGFVIVYFLGNKGFCTYACPYGGFFGLADKFAPGRIRVTDDCEHCGHCTAVCTSNVRVHEEVARFGMVVDPGCMKCMDCVSVCPNDALYFGFRSPLSTTGRLHRVLPNRSVASSQAPKTRPYDFAWWEELLMVVVGLAALLAYRGLYNRIPLLLAMAMAGITAFLAIKLIRLFRDANVRLQNLQLKRGKVTRSGWVFACGVIALLLFAAHSGAIQVQVRRGHALFRDIDIGDQVWLPGDNWWGDAQAEQKERVNRAIDILTIADRWGLAATPAALQDLTWLYLASGNTSEAERTLQRMLQIKPDAAVYRGLASLHRKLNRSAEAEGAYLRALELDPRFDQARLELAAMYLQNGRPGEAIAQFREGLKTSSDDPRFAIELSRSLAALKHFEEAQIVLQQQLREYPQGAAVLAELGLLKLHRGEATGIEDLRRAIAIDSSLIDARYNLAVALLGATEVAESQGRIAEAIEHLKAVVAARPKFAEGHYNLGVATFMSGRPADAIPHVRESLRLAPTDTQAQAFLQMLESTPHD